MKDLKEYIHKTTDLLESHFKLEFDIRNECDRTINISEKYRKYDGEIEFIIELAKQLFKDIHDNSDSNITYVLKREDLENDFKNVFFKSITIIYKEFINSGYDSYNAKYDNKSKLIENVIIHINSNENKSYNDIVSTLVHELTHAWEDYNRFTNKDSLTLSSIIKDTNYRTIVHKINTFSDYDSLCAKILYMFKRFERNAYLSELSSELTGELTKTNAEILNYKDAVEAFKNTPVYQEYVILYEAFQKFYTKEKFISYYNEVNNTSLTPNKIYKKINNKFIKTFNKISSLIPKLYYEYYSSQREKLNEGVLVHPSRAYIEQLELIMNHDHIE